MGTLWQQHRIQDQPATPGMFGINSRIGAAATGAPAVSREDYRSQAILKFYHPSSLDYKAYHRILVDSDSNIWNISLLCQSFFTMKVFTLINYFFLYSVVTLFLCLKGCILLSPFIFSFFSKKLSLISLSGKKLH